MKIKALCLNKPEVGEKSFCCNTLSVDVDIDLKEAEESKKAN